MKRTSLILAGIGVCLLLILMSCGLLSQGVEKADQASITRLLTQFVPTGTPGPVLAANPPAGIIPVTGYSHGNIEMRTADLLDPSGLDCVNYFPFMIMQKSGGQTIEGGGAVFCYFKSTTQIGTANAVMQYDVVVSGKIKPGENRENRLVAELDFAGTLTNYFTNIPEGAFNPFPESKPFVWNDNGPMILNFEFTDGAKIIDTRINPASGTGSASGENQRVFILHLQ